MIFLLTLILRSPSVCHTICRLAEQQKQGVRSWWWGLIHGLIWLHDTIKPHIQAKPFWYLVACYNYLTPNKTVQYDLILTWSTTLFFVSGRKWMTFKKHLVTTRFTRIAVEKPTIKTSFLTKQNIPFMILQHIFQSISIVNGSCQFNPLMPNNLYICSKLSLG